MVELFRAENIGSMLRPRYLKDARLAHAAGTLGHADFKRIEDRAVDEAIALQEGCGVDVVTDGEMRRSTFIGSLTDVVDGLGPVDGHTALWLTPEGRIDLPLPAAVTSRLRRRRSLVAEEYAYARARAQRPLKVTVPSPLMYFPFWSPTHSTGAYNDPFEMFADAVEIVRAEVNELVALGCTYIQLDAPELATMVDPQTREWYATDRDMPAERMHTEGVDMINAAVADARGEGVHLAIHVCRGNNAIADAIFKRASGFGSYLLEYDSQRAGGFEPLSGAPEHAQIVLGLVSTKTDDLESPASLIARIDAAARFFPRDQLAISTQCGFASVEAGNAIAPHTQEHKLRLVAQTARQAWP
jgi:5-methyltetrahydropteroyltriglutamate--homocysteine methyltransferase